MKTQESPAGAERGAGAKVFHADRVGTTENRDGPPRDKGRATGHAGASKPPSEAHVSEDAWSVQGTWSGPAMDNVPEEAMTVLREKSQL